MFYTHKSWELVCLTTWLIARESLLHSLSHKLTQNLNSTCQFHCLHNCRHDLTSFRKRSTDFSEEFWTMIFFSFTASIETDLYHHQWHRIFKKAEGPIISCSTPQITSRLQRNLMTNFDLTRKLNRASSSIFNYLQMSDQKSGPEKWLFYGKCSLCWQLKEILNL